MDDLRIAVFYSKKIYEEQPVSHNKVYLPDNVNGTITGTKVEAVLREHGLKNPIVFNADGMRAGNTVVKTENKESGGLTACKVTDDSAEFDLIFTPYEIISKYEPCLADKGAVVDGNITIEQDTEWKNGMICTGTLTVVEGAELILSGCVPVFVKDLVISGKIRTEADELGFKPGRVVGDEDNGRMQTLIVNHEVHFKGRSSSITGKRAVLVADKGVVECDVLLTGMFQIDHLSIGADLIFSMQSGAWLISEDLKIGDNTMLTLSETEICVLQHMHKAEGKGFYDHTGYGKTLVGDHVRVKGDNTFIWLWFGEVAGEFEDVSGNITLKTACYNLSARRDMENIKVTPVLGMGTEKKPYHIEWYEKDKEYHYRNPKHLAVDAVVNNKIQDTFPDMVFFSILGMFYGYSVIRFRAANILIHTANDLQTFADFADVVVIVAEKI